jgi:hypothetical protein
MLSAVPVSRLIEGIAASLRTHVDPHVTDPFAQMQLRAIDELLRNLAGRVEWSLTELNAEIVELELLFGKLLAAGWPDEPPAGAAPARPFTSADEALSYRLALLSRLTDAIAWAQRHGSDDVCAMVTEVVRARNNRERGQLESGMYS